MFARRGFAVEIPRLPGHGTTWREMLPTRYDDWRAAVHATTKRLKERYEHVVLVGLSMGGTLSLDVASGTDARVSGVVTINAQILDREGFVVKLGPGGANAYGRVFGGGKQQLAWALAGDPLGGAAVVGSFHGAIDFGFGPFL